MKVKKAVIPAAGFGTRSLPATKVVPKELLPIVDKPGIQYIVEEAIAAGCEEIIFVISKGKESIADHFKSHPALEEQLTKTNKQALLESITALNKKATYRVVYQDHPRGLGHAVLCAKEAVGNDWFFVFLPDDLISNPVPCATQMLTPLNDYNAGAIAVMEVPWEQVSMYGVVKAHPLTAHVGKIESVIEKPKRDVAPSNLAIIGRYLLPPSIFTHLEKTSPGAIGEIQLTDGLLSLLKDEELYAYQFEGERFDVGNKAGFVEANIHYALHHPETKDAIQKFLDLQKER
ncbi:UTP--glucose-1-phosphate uridylyltransferase GalU [bacterium]|nr:UTP--glucose-1-phosphate uridylyltransferase GalU [bacterium]